MSSLPILLVHWEKTLGELLDRTARFPKAVRFTFVGRMDTLGLNILEGLIRARWQTGERAKLLAQADADLAVLRTFLRLSYERHYIDRGGLELLAKAFDEAGRMLGGWRKALEEESYGESQHLQVQAQSVLAWASQAQISQWVANTLSNG